MTLSQQLRKERRIAFARAWGDALMAVSMAILIVFALGTALI